MTKQELVCSLVQKAIAAHREQRGAWRNRESAAYGTDKYHDARSWWHYNVGLRSAYLNAARAARWSA